MTSFVETVDNIVVTFVATTYDVIVSSFVATANGSIMVALL